MSLLPDLKANEDETSYYADKTWVQCESPRCLKWRLVPKGDEARAELDHGKPWYCHMNPDPLFSHCSIPQGPFPNNSQFKEHGLKVVCSLLPVGSLVLVKACKWPWWPAILSPDPNMEEYVRLGSEGYVEHYHVEFLGRPHTRYWAAAKHPKYRNLQGAMRKSYEVAMEEVAKVMEMGCEERLQFSHFQPQELMSQAQRLMHAIERMLKECSNQQDNQGKVETFVF
ncbi:zinc finger CW-type PWWP domain protein 2 homolog isoform X2 [Coregonus clupeaformis]|uniref:zinc finger CW-type PWWP domain protein 2 homolog isoform X2 n=1 Tax=Coregonus clupeaformis TaxID=59861 RepID=UPI001BE07D3D|nr:zinc finger CW-type PWWP domain protein 2 homolog isoform X2 [Coregonus clupeaformis]